MNKFNIEILLTEYPDLPYRIREFSDKLTLSLQLKENVQDTLKAYKFSHEGKSKTVVNPVLEAVVKSSDIHGVAIEYYQRTIDEYTKRLVAMEEVLKSLEPQELEIIKLRYFQRREWKYISHKIHYVVEYCMEMRSKILEKLMQDYKG